jgi:hypothetical protein
MIQLKFLIVLLLVAVGLQACSLKNNDTYGIVSFKIYHVE